WVMSQCPFGKGAEGVAYKVLPKFPDGAANLRIAFIVDEAAPGQFKSLHGDEETALNRVQACVGELTPDKQIEFIARANETTDDWTKTAEAMKLDIAAIEACTTDGRADKILSVNAAEARARGINASPTLFVAGERFDSQINSLDLFTAICAKLGSNAPPVCANPPDDLSRSDGMSAGQCGAEAEPQVDPSMVDNSAFQVTIIYPAQAYAEESDKIVEQMKRLFPKMTVDKSPSTSAAAKKMIADYGIEWLPAFIYPKEFEKAKTFERLRPAMKPLPNEKGFMLDPVQIGAGYSLTRERKAGALDVIYTPFSPRALTILLDAVEVLATDAGAKVRDKVTYRPAGFLTPTGDIETQFGAPEREEMERHIAVQNTGGAGAFRNYLDERRKDPVSSYWEDFVKRAKLDPAKVKDAAQSPPVRDALQANSRLASDFAVRTDIVFIVENREAVVVKDKEDFKRLLDYLSRQ
ncbi:DsbA family protein, partial [bacterium]|nr:DsbA family protein [bacterium]